MWIIKTSFIKKSSKARKGHINLERVNSDKQVENYNHSALWQSGTSNYIRIWEGVSVIKLYLIQTILK